MDYPMQFIHAGPAYSTLTEYVPAPYLRKSFRLEVLPEKAELLICGLGFYIYKKAKMFWAFAWATASRTTPAAMCGILRKPASGEHRSWPWGWR